MIDNIKRSFYKCYKWIDWNREWKDVDWTWSECAIVTELIKELILEIPKVGYI